jgi:RHS repeat-associated protein
VHSDHLNAPRKLTNADGQAVWQWGYSAFGEDKPTLAKNRFANLETTPNPGTTSISEVKFNLRYPGQYADEESGLNYNYFRSYDSRTGRYSQSDPIGLDGGWNRFGYVSSNPLSSTDPLGLQAVAALPLAPTLPAAAGACVVGNPAACVAGAGVAGLAVGTWLYPHIEPQLSPVIDWCMKSISGAEGLDCKAERTQCTIMCTDAVLDGSSKPKGDRGNVFGGSFEQCVANCLPEACGGEPKSKGWEGDNGRRRGRGRVRGK